jgi:glycolate oxidase FAD binding subunit
MTFVSGAGEQITVGGRTVKNVAGYDVTRMMVGNLNGLGLITELTLRTRALPEAEATLDVEGIDEPALTRSLTALLCSEGAPDALSWRQEIGGRPRLTMTYLGREGAVAVRRDAGQRWLGETFDPAAVELERSEREGRAAVAPPGGVPSARWSAAAVMKLIVPAGLSGDLVHQLRSAGPPAGSAIESLPSEGIVFISGAWAGEEAARMDGAVLPLVERMGGLRVWMRWPGDTGSLVPVAPKPADWSVVRRVKRALDPGCVLNPGRIEPYDGGEA